MSARREASKRLGIALDQRYGELVNASGEVQVSQAAVMLGALFNENIEQIIYFLKAYGGVKQLPLEKRVVKKALPKPAFLDETPASRLPEFLTK